MIRSVVKRRMKNLLSLLKSNKRWQATRQSFYPSPVYKILTNVPNPDWIEPSTARSSTESVYRIQTSIPLEKFIFESDEPIKDSRVSRHFFESETPPFAQFPRLNENKKKKRERETDEKKNKNSTRYETIRRNSTLYANYLRIPSLKTTILVTRIISIVSRSAQEEDGTR